MTTSPLPDLLTVDDWFALTFPEDSTRHELVRGFVQMSPSEVPLNRFIVWRLSELVRQSVGRGLAPLQAVDVVLYEVPATVRIPDLTVVPVDAIRRDGWIWGRDVDLAVEVVSPSSTVTDWVTKRDEYAAAGVTAYLVVDVQSETPRMALFDRVVDGTYADPVGDGRSVRLTIAGQDITITLDDLLP